MNRTLIRGGTLVLPEGPRQADLLLEGEMIAAIGPALAAQDAQVVDAAGCLVLPGAIDTHTHMALPVAGTVTADDFETGTRAAILGGTTVILDFATQDRGGTLSDAYNVWRGRMDGRASCDVGFHMAITDWNETTAREIDVMTSLGITSYKLYMAYPALMVEDDAILEALRRIGGAGAIAGFHCENGRLVTAMTAEQQAQGHMAAWAHPLSRPPEVEAEAIGRLLRIAQIAGAPVNVVHLSSAMGLETILRLRAPSQTVYIETCPQYLLLDDTRFDAEDGAKYVCSPPIRKKADQAALWGALADGTIATVGTDHCSFNYQGQKTMGKDDFSKIPNGLPGVEHRLALMMTEGVDAGRLTLSQLVEKLCENPARLFGLYPRKGILAVGSDADVVVWDKALAHTITAAAQAQHVDYTPYEGMHVSGGVRDVWLRGGHVVQGGSLVQPQKGQYLHRKQPF